jgi:pimeloyl-ACP methyl ester carboxylesterase
VPDDGPPSLDERKKSKRSRRWLPITLVVPVALLVAALTGWAILVHGSRRPAPGAFYVSPSPLPAGPPGTIIRTEAIDGFTSGATAYRVLYKSTGFDGRPAAVSGLILVPESMPPAQGRKVVAYTHGTVGVVPSCAPTLITDEQYQPLLLEGGRQLLAAGYAIAASDYRGLGTPGPHPYLVGDAAARDTLDIVRAARNLTGSHASDEFVVWGHSQGGHASLFTGQLASVYAPELRLRGVAAGGPVPDLEDLFRVNVRTTVGRALIAMALYSWARVYDDANLDQILTPVARPLVASIAKNCLYSRNELLASVPAALTLGLTFLRQPPWKIEPWKTITAANTPGNAPTRAPILIVQGGADSIVPPGDTAKLAAKLCANGEKVDLRVLPGIGHLATSIEAIPYVVGWTADRFAGKPPPTTCG